MNPHEKTKDELIEELEELYQKHEALKKSYENTITKNIQAEEVLRENQELFRKALDLGVVGMATTHPYTFYFLSANKRLCEMVGYTEEELLQKTWAEITFPKEKVDEDSANVLKLLRGELNGYVMEKQYQHKDGHMIDITLSVQGVTKKDGSIDYILILADDITQRKLAEKALREASEYSRKLIETSLDALVTISAEGKITDVNAATEKITGLSREMLIGSDFSDYFTEPDKARSGYLKVFEDGQVIDYPLAVRHASGKVADVLYNASVYRNEQGEVIGVFAAARDITQRKQTERELIIAKEKAEESERLKSAFLANMSHEIRTPMNGILGFAELLKEPNLSGDEQQEYIKIIEKSGARMLNIINNIVDFSKIEAGLMNVALKDTNINEIIEFVYTFFKPQAEEKRMQLFIRNSLPIEATTIRTDREKIYSILTNLVKNAIKYSNEGVIEVGCTKKGNYLEFSVKDSGIGIPKERLEAIFERFIQADITDVEARQGAGLGLSISKAYVEMLGGKIWVESELAKGSSFYFSIPYNIEKGEENIDQKVVPRDSEKYLMKNLKILIADDDEISNKLVSLTVKDYCKEIIETKNGVEAVKICQQNPDLDLVLMDIQMPDMNGHEATRHIREFNNKVTIIAQTAFGLSGDREKAINAGCNDYITKPINRSELNTIIQKHINNHSAID